MNTQTWYTFRFARWLFRLAWNRHVALSLITLSSLLVVYYQWENRRSARELKAARERLLARIGTENWLDLAAPRVPDEQNFFALPVVEQWMHRDGKRIRYVIPKGVFLPEGFVKPEILENETEGTSRVDFASWAKNRDWNGESPAAALNRELGDGNGLLPKLTAGLSRPFSAWKPHQRDEFIAAGANPYDVTQPHISNVNQHMLDLGLHLRVAAAAGDLEKTRNTALILLRLFPESATSHHGLVGSLVSTAAHGIAFEALQDALGQPAWTVESLRAIQLQLAKINDLEVIERAMSMETLTGYGVGLFIRESCRKDGLAVEMLHFGNENDSWLARLGNQATRLGYIYGPTGWHDASTAFYVECYLDTLGPAGETEWMSAPERQEAIKSRYKAEYVHNDWLRDWNMRRKIGLMSIPRVGNLFPAAAETLFHRRCLIIACELEKHRLRHGAYPATLPVLSGFDTQDPAAPSKQPGYKLEATGYVLTSAQGWQWRMKRTL
ncbi:MAG: hypothetical protein U1F81_07555 [Verrucomicrobiaceae bacterium]